MLDPRASAVWVPVDISIHCTFFIAIQRLTPPSRPTVTRFPWLHIIVFIIQKQYFFCCYVSNFISFLQYYWSDISAITPDYRLTVEVKNIKDAAVSTKLTSSPLEGKPVKENNCNIFY